MYVRVWKVLKTTEYGVGWKNIVKVKVQTNFFGILNPLTYFKFYMAFDAWKYANFVNAKFENAKLLRFKKFLIPTSGTHKFWIFLPAPVKIYYKK